MKYRFLMYGEQTTQLNMRVPESKKAEIQKKFEEILKGYENPKRVEVSSGIEKPKEVKKVEKKIEPQVVEEDKERTPYLVVNSIPFSSEIFINFGKGKAIRKDGDDYYTKETKNGKLLLLKHASKEDAILYAELNFY